MRRYSTILVPLLALFLLWMSVPRPVSAQEVTSTPEALTPAPAEIELAVTATPAAVGISYPGSGAVLSGAVAISGSTFSTWDLSFSFADDPTGTWFPLAQSTDPVSSGTLATWDTTSITDGFYVLRLHISAADGSQDFKVSVRVRNYSQVETATPALTPTDAPTFTTTPIPAERPTATATFTPVASPTMPAPLPPNPATLNPQEIAINFGKGVLSVIVLFVFFGLLLSLSRKLRA